MKKQNIMAQAAFCGNHLKKYYPSAKVKFTGRYERMTLPFRDDWKYSGCRVPVFEFYVQTEYGTEMFVAENVISAKLGIPCADPWLWEEEGMR